MFEINGFTDIRKQLAIIDGFTAPFQMINQRAIQIGFHQFKQGINHSKPLGTERHALLVVHFSSRPTANHL